MTQPDSATDANALREAADGFFLAAEHGRSDVIKALADHSAGRLDLSRIVDAATGRTPLHVAVIHRKTDALRVLLTAGFPPNVQASATPTSSRGTSSGSDRRTPYALATEAKAHDLVFVFHQFAIQQVAMNSAEGVAQLLEGGVPVDMTDGAATGNTLLHWAVTCRAIDVARFLLEEHDATTARVLVDLVNAEGTTPLHLACRDGQLDFVRLLLQHGADPRCTGTGGFCKGKTPVDLVTSTEIRALLTSHEEALHAAKLKTESEASVPEARDARESSGSSGGAAQGDDGGDDAVLAAVRRKHALQLEEKDLLIRQLKVTIESLVVESQEIRKLGEERTMLDYVRKLREEKEIVRRQLEDAEDHIRIQQQQIKELKRELRNMHQQPKPTPPLPPRSTGSVGRVPEASAQSTASVDVLKASPTDPDAKEASVPPLRVDTSAAPPPPRSQRSRATPPRSSRSTRSDSGSWSDVWNVLWGNGLQADEVDSDGEVIMTV